MQGLLFVQLNITVLWATELNVKPDWTNYQLRCRQMLFRKIMW